MNCARIPTMRARRRLHISRFRLRSILLLDNNQNLICQGGPAAVNFAHHKLPPDPGCRLLRGFLQGRDGTRHSALHLRTSNRSLLISQPVAEQRYDAEVHMLRLFHDERIPVLQAYDSARTLLSAVDGLPNKQRTRANSTLHQLLRSCERIMAAIDTLAANTTLLLSAPTIQKRPCDLVCLLRNACANAAGTAAERGVRLRFQTESSQITCDADAEMVLRILQNLLSNAFKHMPSGGEVDVLLSQMDECTACLAVADNGSGIPPDIVGRVFERFVIAPDDPCPGIGLGLNNVKLMALQHGGRVRCTSTQGVGTTVEVMLPL